MGAGGPTALDQARAQVVAAVTEYSTHLLEKELLGRQALGLIPFNEDGARRAVSEIVSSTLAESLITNTLSVFEEMMDSLHGYDSVKNWDFLRRFKGAIDMSLVMMGLRAMSAAVGGALGGNMTLRGLSSALLGKLRKTKNLGAIEWLFGGRITQAIHTGNQQGIEGTFHPEVSDLTVEEEYGKPGLQLDDTTKALAGVIKELMVIEPADLYDRDVDSEPATAMFKALKEYGVHLRWLMDARLLDARLPDAQYVDEQGQFQQYHQPGEPVHPTTVANTTQPPNILLERSRVIDMPERLIRIVESGLTSPSIFGIHLGDTWKRIHGSAATQRRRGLTRPSIFNRPTNP
jgi:hypothetical protein